MVDPQYMLVGPLAVYVAAAGTAGPADVDEAVDTNDWTLLGTLAGLDQGEAGVKVSHPQKVDIFRGQDAAPRIVYRSEEDVTVDIELADVQIDNYTIALNMAAGVDITQDAGTAQVETATVVGSVTGDGDASVVITSAIMDGGGKTVSVAVLNGDTASDVGGKIRAALGADTDVTDYYTVGGTGADVALTVVTPARANDATLNIAIDNDTCTGLTAAPTSANTTAGVESRPGYTPIDIYQGQAKVPPVALLMIGESPALAGGRAEWYLPFVIQDGPIAQDFTKTAVTLFALTFRLLPDPDDATASRMGNYRIKTAAALP